MNKLKTYGLALVASGSSAFATTSSSITMTSNPQSGLSGIAGHADAALGVAITIGIAVVGWTYVKRLIKKG